MMRSGAAIYRALLRLYPREFRRHHRHELEQLFADLITRDGAAATWRRCLVDLAVTVPRYRLETIMSTTRSTAVLVAAIVCAVLAAVATFAMGLYPVAVIGLGIGVALTLTERSHLARSLRPTNPAHRHTLWRRSAYSALTAAAILTGGMADLANEDTWPVPRVIAYNIAFFAAAITAVTLAVIALRQPRPNQA